MLNPLLSRRALDKPMKSAAKTTVHIDTQIARSNWIRKVSSSSLVPAAIVLLGLLIRLTYLGSKSLWLDEMWSIEVARVPWHAALWSFVHQDGNMSLYHAVLHIWMYAGQSEFVIRALSAMGGAGTILVVYLVGKVLFERPVAIMAGMLLALNLFHVQYSQEARSYSLDALFTSISSLLFIKCIERPLFKNWFGYVLVSIAAVYLHVFALLVLAAQWASIIFLRPRDVPWKGLVTSSAAIGVLSAPLGYVLYLRSRSPYVPLNWVPRPSIRRVYDLFYTLVGNANFYGVDVGKAPGGKLLLVAYLVVCLTVLIFAVNLWRSKGRSFESWRLGLLFTWFTIPIVLDLGVSFLQSMFLNRYLIICVPPLALLAAKGIYSIKPKWIAMSLAWVMIAAELVGMPQYYSYRSNYSEWKAATNYIVQNSRPGDSIFFCIASGQLLFDYYRETDYPSKRGDLEVIYPNFTDEKKDPNVLAYLPPLNEQLLNSVTTRNGRVWLVLYPDNMAPGTEQGRRIRATLSAAYPRITEIRIDTIILLLYSRKSDSSNVAGQLTAPEKATNDRQGLRRPQREP